LDNFASGPINYKYPYKHALYLNITITLFQQDMWIITQY